MILNKKRTLKKPLDTIDPKVIEEMESIFQPNENNFLHNLEFAVQLMQLIYTISNVHPSNVKCIGFLNKYHTLINDFMNETQAILSIPFLCSKALSSG